MARDPDSSTASPQSILNDYIRLWQRRQLVDGYLLRSFALIAFLIIWLVLGHFWIGAIVGLVILCFSGGFWYNGRGNGSAIFGRDRPVGVAAGAGEDPRRAHRRGL